MSLSNGMQKSPANNTPNRKLIFEMHNGWASLCACQGGSIGGGRTARSTGPTCCFATFVGRNCWGGRYVPVLSGKLTNGQGCWIKRSLDRREGPGRLPTAFKTRFGPRWRAELRPAFTEGALQLAQLLHPVWAHAYIRLSFTLPINKKKQKYLATVC